MLGVIFMIYEKQDNSHKYMFYFLIALILFIAYFYWKVKEIETNEIHQEINDSVDESQNVQENFSSYNYNLTKRKEVQSISKDYIEVIVDMEGKAYLSLIGNIDYEENIQIKRSLSSVKESFASYFPEGYVNESGTQLLSAYQLDLEKVLTVYHVSMGNGNSSYFIFVKENGTLAYLDYNLLIYTGKIEIQNIDELENIISVVENTYSKNPYVIDINGNEFSLYDYIDS